MWTVEVKFVVKIKANGKIVKLKSIKIFSAIIKNLKFSAKKIISFEKMF